MYKRVIFRRAVIGVAALAVASCHAELPQIQIGRIGDPAPQADFRGLIAGGEPTAVLTGEKILLGRGNAVDAAVSIGFVLTVTLPSRAGVGGGGACIVHDIKSGKTEAIDFSAALGLPRGLFALHARYGTLPWPELVAPAENTARFGTRVSRAFARDLETADIGLFADGSVLTAFLTSERRLLSAGDILVQADLAAYLERVRNRRLEGPMPRWRPVRRADASGQDVFFLPENAEAKGAASTTGFTVADANGNAVSCALTMGNPFGMGRMIAGDGVLQAPHDLNAGGLVAVIAIDGVRREARLGVAGSGDQDNIVAALRVGRFTPDKALSAWSCPRGVMSDGRACDTTAVPDGYALAVVPGGKM